METLKIFVKYRNILVSAMVNQTGNYICCAMHNFLCFLDDNWLNGITYATSPTGELIALAQGEKLAFLCSVWDFKSQTQSYSLSWCGELENPYQIITSLLCLPMYGKSVSSGAEWTCIALGLNSGMVVFYTDCGIKLYSQW